jgi:hypothetical protein
MHHNFVTVVLAVIISCYPSIAQDNQQPGGEGFNNPPAYRSALQDSPAGDSAQVKIYGKTASELFHELGPGERLNQNIFESAIAGYYHLKQRALLSKENLLTIIDYTRPSTEARFYVIDLKTPQLVFNTLVAHGKKTGENFARHFSDRPGSLQSSLGFYVTGKTYTGANGYSLELKGMEPAFNGNAEVRRIVMHGAWYVSQEFSEKHGRLGRSWGCPALPLDLARKVIDTIKEGSCLFIYYDDPNYLLESKYLKIE